LDHPFQHPGVIGVPLTFACESDAFCQTLGRKVAEREFGGCLMVCFQERQRVVFGNVARLNRRRLARPFHKVSVAFAIPNAGIPVLAAGNLVYRNSWKDFNRIHFGDSPPKLDAEL
jgi:hypothetical protein